MLPMLKITMHCLNLSLFHSTYTWLPKYYCVVASIEHLSNAGDTIPAA